MSNCDPAYETCPETTDWGAVLDDIAENLPREFYWGIIPVLDFVAGYGNMNAWNSWLADTNAYFNIDLTWADFGVSATSPWTSPPIWF